FRSQIIKPLGFVVFVVAHLARSQCTIITRLPCCSTYSVFRVDSAQSDMNFSYGVVGKASVPWPAAKPMIRPTATAAAIGHKSLITAPRLLPTHGSAPIHTQWRISKQSAPKAG